jgi:hypothetical protein
VNVPMRDGEKPGCTLKADMTYWHEQNMMPEFTFEDSVDATLDYVLSLPKHVKKNALKFYGKVLSNDGVAGSERRAA